MTKKKAKKCGWRFGKYMMHSQKIYFAIKINSEINIGLEASSWEGLLTYINKLEWKTGQRL